MFAFPARVLFLLVGLALCLLGSIAPVSGQDATPPATPSSASTGVSREVLNTDLPEMAPGYALMLTRVVIEPGGAAAAPTHPGTQLIHIESGTILYSVVRCELPYTLAGEAGQPGVEGILEAGETMEFGPGDRFTVGKGMIHIAENRDDVPVVILAAALLAPNLPASIPIDVDQTATPAP